MKLLCTAHAISIIDVKKITFFYYFYKKRVFNGFLFFRRFFYFLVGIFLF